MIPSNTASLDEGGVLGKLAFTCLWLLVFVIPWENAVVIQGFGTATRVIGMIALAVGVLAIIARGKIRFPSPGHIILALFVVWAAISYLWSIAPDITSVKSSQYCRLFVMVWLIWEFSASVRSQMRLFQAYVLGTCVSGFDTLYHFLSHRESDYLRYTGAGFNADDMGLIMALSIPISYYLLLQDRQWSSWAYRIQLLLAIAAIFLAAARGGFLAALVALAIFPLTYTQLTRHQKVEILLMILLVIAGLLWLVPESSWERLATIPREVTRGTLTGRTVIWTAGWEVFREHPFLGVGAGAYGYSVVRTFPVWKAQTPGGPYAHNTFLSVAVEEGAIGVSLFCALLGVLALSTRELPNKLRTLWSVLMVVWLTGVSSLSWEMQKATWFLFALLMVQHATMTKVRQSAYQQRLMPTMPVNSAQITSTIIADHSVLVHAHCGGEYLHS